MTRIRRLALAVTAGALICALAACATPTPSDSSPAGSGAFASPELPDGDVIGQGTVIDADGRVRLCLGPIAESYPPQCAGLPVTGWTWEDVEGYETAGDTRWGAYAVQGTYDGESFTVTQPPVILALYDPMTSPDPTGAEPGRGIATELQAIQDELPGLLGSDLLSASVADSRLWIDVVWDDGTRQAVADAVYGEEVIVVRSALRPVQG
ncbi:hypothetical protein NQ152_16845 [Microbacterium sp. zg.B48]|uniref:hypothetical protein n=1 Tax=unclassified Microbacterium TaxID=2609290 RepID=UPI00214AF291|nr:MULTISPECIES: hypothetical protein [unclassified Microbacterium]MCR2765175.1 hypothetical protein [Microbacterium sp. zg.B48]MCR2809547.1 hypothetical protein [Microbacterium sp. zg.B185]WIM20680.1 hypothetical protein QNO12_07780 [Microbacterium sp. zg-B185]